MFTRFPNMGSQEEDVTVPELRCLLTIATTLQKP